MQKTTLVANNLGSSNDLSMRFTANTQAAATNKIFFIPGRGVIADKSLPANVVYAGPAATWADQVDYLEGNELTVSGIRVQTDNVQNFAGVINIVELKPNRQNNKTTIIELSDFRQNAGADYADTLIIPGSAFGGGVITKERLKMSFENLLQNSFVKITLMLTEWDAGSQQSAIV